jgi:hypothetical protein
MRAHVEVHCGRAGLGARGIEENGYVYIMGWHRRRKWSDMDAAMG